MDELTKVLNRRAGKERLDLMLEQSRKEERPLCVVPFDINHLKTINDNYGHIEARQAAKICDLPRKRIYRGRRYDLPALAGTNL